VNQIRHVQTNTEKHALRQTILDWLSPLDYHPQHSDTFARSTEGTGQWFISSPQFRSWVSATNQTLFCPGIPGAGKTILTSIVIDHLQTKRGQSTETGIAYVYGNFQQQRKPVELLSSLLKQFLEDQDTIPEEVSTLYKEWHGPRQTQATLEEVCSHFQVVLKRYESSFILIDALDECCPGDPSCNVLLAELFRIQRKTKVNIYATSRFIAGATEHVQAAQSDHLYLEIQAFGADVKRYLTGEMLQLPLCVRRNAELQTEIIDAITQCIEGMYASTISVGDN
jgi:Cdc6-like AAA superfamily ATPase